MGHAWRSAQTQTFRSGIARTAASLPHGPRRDEAIPAPYISSNPATKGRDDGGVGATESLRQGADPARRLRRSGWHPTRFHELTLGFAMSRYETTAERVQQKCRSLARPPQRGWSEESSHHECHHHCPLPSCRHRQGDSRLAGQRRVCWRRPPRTPRTVGSSTTPSLPARANSSSLTSGKRRHSSRASSRATPRSRRSPSLLASPALPPLRFTTRLRRPARYSQLGPPSPLGSQRPPFHLRSSRRSTDCLSGCVGRRLKG